jgi:hypothetical protein
MPRFPLLVVAVCALVGCVTASVPQLSKEASQVRVGKSDPDRSVEEIGPIEVVNGSVRSLRDSFDENSFVHSPGMFLARKLVACLGANVMRRPRRSDSVDGMHASYFPYVDVATCDRQTLAWLSSHIGKARGPRTPRLFRNGYLHDVAMALAQLPRPAT